MKQISILILTILFSTTSSFGTEFPIAKFEKLIAKGKYFKAQKKIESYLVDLDEVHCDEHAELWLLRGNSYSLTYFNDVHDVATFDDKTYLSINKYIEEAIYSFKKAHKLGGRKIQNKALSQLTQLQRFFKVVANRYQNLGNYQRFYINARRARTCNIFVAKNIPSYKIDKSLTYMLADAAELAGHPEEAIFLCNELINSGAKKSTLFSKTVSLYLERKDTIRALNALDIGLQLHPKSKKIFKQKVQLLKHLDMQEELAVLIKRNVRKFPTFRSELNFMKGIELQKKYNMDVTSEDLFKTIEQLFITSVKQDPKNQEYVAALADLYYNKALRIKSENTENTEKEYVQILKKARTTLSTALKLGPDDKVFLTNALQFVNSENAAILE